MQYHFKIHKDVNMFWAECIELPGCFTQADNRKELLINMQEALSLYIEEDVDSKDLAPLPNILAESPGFGTLLQADNKTKGTSATNNFFFITTS